MALLLLAGAAANACVDMGRTVAVVVPYRNRAHHLREFHLHMSAYWRTEFPCDTYWLLVVEQDDNNPFNRAALGNVGILETMQLARNSHTQVDCIVFHDVDLVPLPRVPYTTCARPTQLGSELEHFDWKVPYDQSAGGVVSMRPQDWVAINGFSNHYKGWGGEDDDLFKRLQHAKLLAPGHHLHRPPAGHGRFKAISENDDHHPRDRKHRHYSSNLAHLAEWDRKKDNWRHDGLTSVCYRVRSHRRSGNKTHLFVTFTCPPCPRLGSC